MLMELLRALYDPRCGMPQRDDHYRQALEDIELFTISSQVYQLLKDTNLLCRVPGFFRQRLEEKFQQGVFHNLYVKHEEDNLLRMLEQQQIDVIPLKGTRLAERFFGHMGARLSSDVDLYLDRADLKEAIRITEEAGFRFETVKDHHARLHKTGGITAELHWTFDKLEWSDLRTESFSREATAIDGYKHVKELSLLHTFYFMCLHGARHQMDSIRYVLDIAQILHRCGQDLDYGALLELTASDKTSKRVQAVLSITYQVFPHLQEIKPLPFDAIETKWDYSTIKDARLGVKKKRYYAYKLFFRHFLFDTLKHQMKSIRKAY
jgi:hypothetical protein